MEVVVILFVIAIAICIPGVPAFVIAQRRELSSPWVAFVPFVGLWIVLSESAGHSGWFGLAALIPTLGTVVLSIWMAVEVPGKHGRSQWWTAALIIPGLNLIGYWAYAFTLPAPVLRPQGALA
jgi:hypothetical protein